MRWFGEDTDNDDPPTAERRIIARITGADLAAHLRLLPDVESGGPTVAAATADDWLALDLDPRMGADVFHLMIHAVATAPNGSWDTVLGVSGRQRSKPGYFVRPIGSDAALLEGWQDDGRSIAVRVGQNRVWRSEKPHVEPFVRPAMLRSMGIPSGLDIMPLAELEYPTTLPVLSPSLRSAINPTNETTNTRREDLNADLELL